MNLLTVKGQMEYELEMAGLDFTSYCCVCTDTMAKWIDITEAEMKAGAALKEDTWLYEQKLEQQNNDMRKALEAVLELQTRGFITLGDKWTGFIKEALG